MVSFVQPTTLTFLLFLGEDRQNIENMIYYDADISRQQAAQVLEFGGKHSFLIRARKGAGDCTNAPFVKGLKLTIKLYLFFLKIKSN